MIRSIGQIASLALALKIAMDLEMVQDRDNVVICLPVDDALIVYGEIMRLSGPDEDHVKIAVRKPHSRNPMEPGYHTFVMEKPPVPEANGQPWMSFFDIEVFVA